MKARIVFIIINAIILCNLTIEAQEEDKKIAIFDPAGDVDNSIKEIIREEISSIIVNAKGFSIFERHLINKVLEENKFQMSGLVDDSQVSEIGKKIGANYVIISTVTPIGKNYYVSCKMIEVLTARIDKQKTGMTKYGLDDLIEVTQDIISTMFDLEYKIGDIKNVIRPSRPEHRNTTFSSNETLVANRRYVLYQETSLSREDVRTLMANTKALSLYDEGVKVNKHGNIALIGGAFATLCGMVAFNLGGQYGYDDWYLVGVASAIIGIAGLSTSIIFKNKAKKYIEMAVDEYNCGIESPVSNIEVGFGVSQNGIGLVLNF